MQELKYLLQAVLVLILLAVAYATFWVLVAALVVYCLYHLFKLFAEPKSPE